MTNATAGTPPEAFQSLGLHLSIIIVGAVVLLLIALLVFCLKWCEWEPEFPVMISIFMTSTFILIFIGIVGNPFNGTYYKLYEVTGTVTSVNNTMTDVNGELASKPTLELDTVPLPITSKDPRVTLLEGKEATFTCRIGWNYHAADDYTCKISQIHD